MTSWDYRTLDTRPVARHSDGADAASAIVPDGISALLSQDTPGAYAYENASQGQRLATSDGSLVQFFLQKLPEGWRVYKVRTFTSVPKNLYFLPSLKASEDAYDGDMDEYPSTPTSPSFRSSNQASVTLSPW